MIRPISIRFAGSVVLLGALVTACAEGSTQPTGASTGSGDGGSSNQGNGGAGNGGDGGDTSSSKSSSKSSSSSTGSTSNSGSTGEGGGGVCGNGTCDAGENCATCPNDCPDNCGPVCGDTFCNGSETCSSCPSDCQECTADCGNGVCDAGEAQTCPQDCNGSSSSTFSGGGMCPPNACEAGGTADPMCFDSCVVIVCGVTPECCEGGTWTQDCADNAQIAADIGFCEC